MRLRMAGDRLVHGVVEHFRHQMVQRALIGAAHIHAGALAHRLEAFEHLDGGGVIGLGPRVAAEEIRIVLHAPLCVPRGHPVPR